MKTRKISRFVTEGDSLSDRGTMRARYLFGFIPMSLLSGLRGESPAGRFTNGLAWPDHVGAMFSNSFVIHELNQEFRQAHEPRDESSVLDGLDLAGGKIPKSKWNHTDIADAVIYGDEKVRKFIQASYSLKNDRTINYRGENLVRSYNEGGLTSFDYSWVINNIRTWTRQSLKLFFTCLILATLGGKRSQLLEDDRRQGLSKHQKAETINIEWSGANDLITANPGPSIDAANKAVKARIDNVKELMKNGYRHFILFNLPDIALTPRFQGKTKAAQENASVCSNHFNLELKKAIKELSINYPHCSIELFDVDEIFTEVYHNPQSYHFDPAKLTTPYLNSADFRINPDGTSPAKGYMFWDDVHPSADMQALLAERFYKKFSIKYSFSPPQPDAPEATIHVNEDELLAAFRNAHGKKVNAERNRLFRSARPTILQRELDLEDIMTRALYRGDRQALTTMKELHWLNNRGEVNLNIPVLKKAMSRVKEAHRAPRVGDDVGSNSRAIDASIMV